MSDLDVVVVGVGSMGSQALWRLARRGARVAGFDRFQPPHTMGSHHGGSRIIRTAYYEAPEYVPLARSSFALWRELEAETGRDLLTMTGGLHVGPPESPEFAGALRSARQHGLEHEVLERAEAERRFPQHRLAEGELALVERDAGFVRPEDCIAAAIERARGLGAEVHVDAPIEAVEPRGDGVEVRAGGRRWRARRAIVACGAWNSKLALPSLRVPLRVERQAQAWFQAGRPEMHDPRRAPVFVRHLAGAARSGVDFAYGFPSIDGETVKVGVAEDLGEIDPDDGDRRPRPADAAAVGAFVRRAMPDLRPDPVRVAVCLQEYSPDHHFLVGPLPGEPSIVALMGFSGHGFKFASAIGEAAAGMAVDGGTDLAVGHLAVGRFLEEARS
jgi:sarcosine oxidase